MVSLETIESLGRPYGGFPVFKEGVRKMRTDFLAGPVVLGPGITVINEGRVDSD